MKPSTRACENDHNVVVVDSQYRMSLFTQSSVTLAGTRNTHDYQSVFRGNLTVNKPAIAAQKSLKCVQIARSDHCQIG